MTHTHTHTHTNKRCCDCWTSHVQVRPHKRLHSSSSPRKGYSHTELSALMMHVQVSARAQTHTHSHPQTDINSDAVIRFANFVFSKPTS